VVPEKNDKSALERVKWKNGSLSPWLFLFSPTHTNPKMYKASVYKSRDAERESEREREGEREREKGSGHDVTVAFIAALVVLNALCEFSLLRKFEI